MIKCLPLYVSFLYSKLVDFGRLLQILIFSNCPSSSSSVTAGVESGRLPSDVLVCEFRFRCDWPLDFHSVIVQSLPDLIQEVCVLPDLTI